MAQVEKLTEILGSLLNEKTTKTMNEKANPLLRLYVNTEQQKEKFLVGVSPHDSIGKIFMKSFLVLFYIPGVPFVFIICTQ